MNNVLFNNQAFFKLKNVHRFVYGRYNNFKTPEMAAQVYLFGREWMIPKLIKAVGDYLERVTICPEDALKILPHFDAEENNISSKCLGVSKIF
jgi:hypothetical protein